MSHSECLQRDRLCSLVAVGLIFCGVPGPMRAATIDCAPLRPGAQVDSTVEDTIKGQANILLRSLGSGSVENGYRQVESDTLARYPGRRQAPALARIHLCQLHP